MEIRVAVVTGGASGIGRASCARLAQEGYTLAVLDLDADAAKVAAGPEGLGLAADVADAAAVERAVGRVAAEFGRIDLLFNNAGITGTQAAGCCHETPIDEWDRVIGVNLRGPFLMTRAVLPVLLDQGGGHVINLVSIAGMVATRPLRVHRFEGRRADVHQVGGGRLRGGWRALQRRLPRLGAHPDDGVAPRRPGAGSAGHGTDPDRQGGAARRDRQAVAMLASEKLAYVTGLALVIDGGMTSTIMI